MLGLCVGDNQHDQQPPPHDEVAAFSRYLVHDSSWTAMATLANRDPIKDYPFANIFSVSDGPTDGSTGVPYMYLMPLELSAIDLENNDKSSLTMTLAQGTYCEENSLDEQDPRCAHIILTGKIVKIEGDTEEAIVAREALFSRHPDM